MFTRLKNYFYWKFTDYADNPKGERLLGALSFAESSFFPVPPDVFMIPMLLAQKTPRWFRVPFIVSVTSVIGGLFGYAIGYFLFDSVGKFIVETYGLREEMLVVKEYFDRNVFWAIFLAGFTPIPYKLFTIAGGFFVVPLVPFFFASALSRPLRFFLVSYCLKWFGKPVAELIMRRMDLVTIASLALVVLGFLAVYLLI